MTETGSKRTSKTGPGAAPLDEPESSTKPPTLDEALIWISTIPATALLPFLREKENILLARRAFSGFRSNHQGLSFPTVRQRLAQEAVKEVEFGEKLRFLFNAQSSVKKVSGPPRTDSQKKSAGTCERSEALYAAVQQRDRLKRELTDLHEKVSTARSQTAALEVELHRIDTERARYSEIASAQSIRIERLERQLKRRETELGDLLKQVRSFNKDSREYSRESATGGAAGAEEPANHSVDTQEQLWEDSARRILELGHYAAVAPLIAEVVRSAPENEAGLEISAELESHKKDKKKEAEFLDRLVLVQIQNNHASDALTTWSRLSVLKPANPTSKRTLQQIVALLPAKGSHQLSDLARVLARLKTTAPNSYEQIMSVMSKRIDLMKSLDEVSGIRPHLHEQSLIIPLPERSLSIAELVLAINRGNTGIVKSVRHWMESEKRSGSTQAGTVLQSVVNLGGDPAYAVPLSADKPVFQTVIVDSSNVAWIGQEDLADGRPRLGSVLLVRLALLARGYFPVLLFGDANLPHSIDRKEELLDMIDRGELHLVDSGVDADEEIIRNAKRYGAMVVSNDYMEDWDPENAVPKIGITLSRAGQVTFIG